MLRLLHTSDWHLGHTLHDVPREHEHATFLRWLTDRLIAEAVDALIIAGDVFDTANPSADAQQTFYDFLATARRQLPALDIVVIGGNHDSAGRLDAPDPLLRALGIRVVGGLPRGPGAAGDRLLVPLHDKSNAVAAWVVAVPFLRPFDLPTLPGDDALIAGVHRVYADAIVEARALRQPGQALIATGHCYMTGTSLSELSERKILGGNLHALPLTVFPDDLAYVALGHLHRAQAVGGRNSVRYCGSPIPLSLAEAPYKHQVLVADFDGEQLTDVREVLIPRTVQILRVPATGAASLDDVATLLSALPDRGDTPDQERPYLEVEITLAQPEPAMRKRVEEALTGKAARLVRLGVRHEGTGDTLADTLATTTLSDLLPEDVFRARYKQVYQGEPPASLLASFANLVELVHAEAT